MEVMSMEQLEQKKQRFSSLYLLFMGWPPEMSQGLFNNIHQVVQVTGHMYLWNPRPHKDTPFRLGDHRRM